jgi:hypothetical protein
VRFSSLCSLLNIDFTCSGYIDDVLLSFFAELQGEHVYVRESLLDLINHKMFDLAEWTFAANHEKILILQETTTYGPAATKEFLPLLETIDTINTNLLYTPSSPSSQVHHIWECGFLLRWHLRSKIGSLMKKK